MKTLQLLTSTLLFALVMASCGSKNSAIAPDDELVKTAKESITKWMNEQTSDYPNYKPVNFGTLTPRYERNSHTYLIICQIEEEKIAQNRNTNKLDSLERTLQSFDKYFLGYTILHRFSTKSEYGEFNTIEKLFFLDSNFGIITVLDSDAYEQIMDEKLIFRPETSSIAQ